MRGRLRMPVRCDVGTLRNVAWICLLTFVFVVVDTQVAAAADGAGGGLLSPLNLTTSEGAPLEGYRLGSSPGSILNVADNVRAFLLSGLFAVVRLLVGLAGWLVEFVFTFPLLQLLLGPAQKLSDTYNRIVVDTLGLKGLLLGWAFVFGLILFMRGKAARGLGEILLTLLIAAFAASALIRPDYLLGKDGPLNQVHQAAAEVAVTTVNTYNFNTHGSDRPCAGLPAAAAMACEQREYTKLDVDVTAKDIAKPIQDVLTNALIVKPYMLVQYGRLLDPQKDAKAYALHLKWVTGKYKPQPVGGSEETKKKQEVCDQVKGPGGDYCRYAVAKEEAEKNGTEVAPEDVPFDFPGKDSQELSPGAVMNYLSPESVEFQQFTEELSKAGETGKAAAEYAKDSSWERVGAVALVLVAVVLVAAMIGAMALVMLGTQGAEVGASAVGGVSLVWGMLPGPSRAAVWKWLMIFMASTLLMFAVAAFIPAFGIAVDVVLTDGPDLVLERLLLVDAVAVVGLAFHRRLLASATGFADRLKTRMRFSPVGGSHLPGDSSEIGAALATYAGSGDGGHRVSSGRLLSGGGFRAGLLGTRQRLMSRLAALTDGTGMPVNAGSILQDAGAEARRGLAPAMLVATGAGLAARGAYGLAIGRRPDEEQLEKWRKPTSPDGENPGGTPGNRRGGPGAGPGGGGAPMRVDTQTGEILHDPSTDRPLLGTRAHNRLVRFRGYRIARRTGILAYGATYGLPATVNRARTRRSELSEDARQQLRVTGGQLREDGRQWEPVGRTLKAAGREAGERAGDVSRRTATAARNAAATGVMMSGGPDRGASAGAEGAPTSVSRPAGGTSYARQQVMDSLLQAQRATWENPPSWGADDSEGSHRATDSPLAGSASSWSEGEQRATEAPLDPPRTSWADGWGDERNGWGGEDTGRGRQAAQAPLRPAPPTSWEDGWEEQHTWGEEGTGPGDGGDRA
ncbi:hypothetical protein [Streptomyces sp. NPDC048442]|uniref:hypothetical protein n=1 Tax=Streptomyces sp. NPDC048442 TaxID=3154823 RepID=UPI00343EA675